MQVFQKRTDIYCNTGERGPRKDGFKEESEVEQSHSPDFWCDTSSEDILSRPIRPP